MGNILQSHNRQTGFKNIKSSKIPVLHQELLLHNEKVLGKIQISRYAVIKLLKFVPFNFKIYQATKDVADAILKINECLLFCNLTDNRILINIDNIREKVLLLNSNINPKTSHFVTKVIVRHD